MCNMKLYKGDCLIELDKIMSMEPAAKSHHRKSNYEVLAEETGFRERGLGLFKTRNKSS